MGLIVKFDKYNESLAFDKIVSEEVSIDLKDYLEEYDNIFKDRYRCVKAAGPIHQVGEVFNVKDLFKFRFGMFIKRPDRYKGQNNKEEFEIINGWDCDVEMIKLKKGNFITIWPNKAERERYEDRLKDKSLKGLDRVSFRLERRYNEEKKIIIPAGRISLYNLTDYERDARFRLLGSDDGYVGSGKILRGTTDKRHDGKEELVTIPNAVYLSIRYGFVVVQSERMNPFVDRWGNESWRDIETYLDITKPIYGKSIQWFDPELDPYGEEEWWNDV